MDPPEELPHFSPLSSTVSPRSLRHFLRTKTLVSVLVQFGMGSQGPHRKGPSKTDVHRAIMALSRYSRDWLSGASPGSVDISVLTDKSAVDGTLLAVSNVVVMSVPSHFEAASWKLSVICCGCIAHGMAVKWI